MSLDITLHNLDDSIVQVFVREAEAHGTTTEKEMSEALRRAAMEKLPIAERLKMFRLELKQSCGPFPNTTELLRQERDAWGAQCSS